MSKTALTNLLFVLIFSLTAFAQQDGQLVNKTYIADFAALENYIEQTEQRDSLGLHAERYERLADVNLYGITYYSDGLKVKGFILTPKGEGPYPAILYNRGGSLEWGSLTHWVSSIGLGELAELAMQGYVIAASQYRGNGGGEGREEYGGADINDIMNLKHVLAATPEADTSRIGMFGWSRGGMMSFVTLRRFPKTHGLKAVVVGGPGTNLVQGVIDRPELNENWSMIIPGYAEDRTAALKERSVLYWADELPRNVPILLLQGMADWHLRPDETLELAIKLQKNKVPFRLVAFEGAEHAIREHHDEKMRQIVSWFDRFLKQGEKLPKIRK